MGNLEVICVTGVSQNGPQVALGDRGTVAATFVPRVGGSAAVIGASSGTPDVPDLCPTRGTQTCSCPTSRIFA